MSSSRERFEAWHEEYLKKDIQLHTKWDVWKARDAEVERLVEALHDARDTLCSMNAEYAHNLINRIDALLREYDEKEKRDGLS